MSNLKLKPILFYFGDQNEIVSYKMPIHPKQTMTSLNNFIKISFLNYCGIEVKVVNIYISQKIYSPTVLTLLYKTMWGLN